MRANVPKLFFAGSLADEDLKTARQFASTGGGWTNVTSVPVKERGTAILATPWRTRLGEEITAFLRDCLRSRPGIPPRRRLAPRPPG